MKAVVDRDMDETAQLSVEPLFTCEAVTLTLFPLSDTVMFLQRAVGLVTSCTVTVPAQEPEFPLPSASDSVTVLVPRSAQV